MHECKPSDTPVAKGDKFSLSQCPKNDFEVKEIQRIPYCFGYRESNVYIGLYTFRYYIHYWDARLVFK